ncbi:TPA: hypothetical protein N0F65_003179 [Lagenidium giganteum]|uniref:Acyltransferase n=1 Tax=Lagenidium giganteum TaxID=4803 RepID=A0AAV2Z9K7_9STRA|nr:TPA: hypothetical protein N0F65_003179 [Lagenidium giganteum]
MAPLPENPNANDAAVGLNEPEMEPSSLDNAIKTERPTFPCADDNPALQSLYAQVWRRLGLFLSLFPFVIVTTTHVLLALLSALAVAAYVVVGHAVPLLVQVYVALLVCYFSYRAVMPHAGESTWLHDLARHTYTDFPYFQFQKTIFEEHGPNVDPRKPLVDADAKSVFAFHPHGIVSCGWLVNGTHCHHFAKSNAEWLVTDNLFWFPIVRDLLKWTGFGPVSRRNFVRLLDQARNICLIPGGFEEATIFERGKHRVFIKNRMGFIKLALQYGYKVHPVYTFGEELTYHSFHYFLKLRILLNQFKVPAVLFQGSRWAFFMPKSDVNLVTVVGKPIQLPTIANPTRDDVKKYHDMYIAALTDLFERNKLQYAQDPSATLEVF